MSLPIAILAGGLATRLHPETLEIPKSLLKINNRAFIDYQLDQISSQGFENVVLCLGHKSDYIIDHVGNGNKFNLNIEFSVEDRPLGTGGAIKNALHFLGENFGILYGDSYLPIDLNQIVSTFTNSRKLALMTIYENLGRFDTSNVRFTSEGSLVYSKRETNFKMNYIDYGFSVVNRKAFKHIPSNIFYDLSELWEKLSKSNELLGKIVHERFYEIGSREGIVDFENFLKGEK